MKPILEIQGIGKKYQINGNKKPYLSLRESLFSFLKSGARQEEFWALQDISFDIMPGDTIGIIGRNGAGKSTLLKILSKITPPTKGKVIARGRIASLLEVGTGFHSELNGKENIFMNGSILGLKKNEIRQNFDAIVDFAGVEKFINTPLKHYSSGMQLRLAFAVAAFLQNEVLIIDEVLAVGDAEFQKKCMGKMKDVSGQGRTVLFVSHNIAAVQSLCKRAILLDQGKLKMQGSISEVIDAYVNQNNKHDQSKFVFHEKNDIAFANSLEIFDAGNNASTEIEYGTSWKAIIEFTVQKQTEDLIIGLGLINEKEVPIRNTWNKVGNLAPGKYKAIFHEKDLFFSPGSYRLIVGLSNGKHSIQYIDNELYFRISNVSGNPQLPLLDSSGAIVLNQMQMALEKQ